MGVDTAYAIGLWVAAIAGLITLGKQVYDFFYKRQERHEQTQIALDQAPLIKKELEIGNFSGAITALNHVVTTQAQTIDNQVEYQEVLENRIAARDRKIEELENRVADLEGRLGERSRL